MKTSTKVNEEELEKLQQELLWLIRAVEDGVRMLEAGQAGEARLETYGKTLEADPEVKISKNGAYILVHDPSDYPLEAGMRIPADQVDAGLDMGTFTPHSKIRKGETVFTVYGAPGKKQMLRAERC